MGNLVDTNVLFKQASTVVNKINMKYKGTDLTEDVNIVKFVNTLFSYMKSENDYELFEHIVANDLLRDAFDEGSYLKVINIIKDWLEKTIDMSFHNPLYFLYVAISSKVESEGSQWVITVNAENRAFRFTNNNLFYLLSLGLSNISSIYSVIVRKDDKYLGSFVTRLNTVALWPSGKDLQHAHNHPDDNHCTSEDHLVYTNMKEVLPEYFYLMSMVRTTVN